MQDALRILQEYWTSHGCLSVQPYNTEVGAGTMNPATVMRVLGPEPWNVAYVEPSVRPDDSRYGNNPNRLQTHTQFQVILKPEPGNPQELYLGSLEALGIDLKAHDVRFVEDNWQQPAIGAWGLGWEVWLDGMEITQFTYFQQVGGQNLNPVPVELTYGMERILMAMQGVNHFQDIQYAPGISYGEAFGQNEYEMSRYYLDDADVAANWNLYETYIAEAQRMVDARLPVPAHTYVLKSSHAFNVLDARGAISTTQRAKAFASMRKLARQVSKLWIARREELGLPLLKGDAGAHLSSFVEPTLDLLSGAATQGEDGTITQVSVVEKPDTPQTFTLEVGVEELPPHVLAPSIEQVRQAVVDGLAASRLEYGQVWADGTPRRIIVTVADVAPAEEDAVTMRKGPKWQAAFDADGNPTKALQGFARGAGVDVADVVAADFGGSQHAAVEIPQPGRDVLTVLQTIISDAVDALRADKNMRWRDSELSFSRAVRWLLALWGPVIVPATVSGLVAGRTTYVHRTDDQPFVAVGNADELLTTLADRTIMTVTADRRAEVVRQAHDLAATVAGTVDIEAVSGLVDEITNLVETPHGVIGAFDARYLELPEEILTEVMASHQRYLPVRDAAGTLMPYFITMANGVCDDDVVRTGNESVLRARYEDALFFWEADLEVADIETFIPNLDKLSFADGLGSVMNRARRIEDVANVLGNLVQLGEEDQHHLARAGQLVKFDLGTQLVTEMSSLAGFVGKEYAKRKGEAAPVATAIEEAELPHSASGELPQSAIGSLLAVADRADLLVGLLATGAKASGSSDQFGLRRAALGLMRILREHGAHHGPLAALTLDSVLATAADRLIAQGVAVTAEHVDSAAQFARGRFEQLLRDEGVSAEMVAALSATTNHPATTAAYAQEIGELADSAHPHHDAFNALIAALVRIVRIIPADSSADYEPEQLTESAERELISLVEQAPGFTGSWSEFAQNLRLLSAGVQTFFEDTLVMAEDPAVRAARIGLLASVVALAPADMDYVKLDQALDVAAHS